MWVEVSQKPEIFYAYGQLRELLREVLTYFDINSEEVA